VGLGKIRSFRARAGLVESRGVPFVSLARWGSGTHQMRRNGRLPYIRIPFRTARSCRSMKTACRPDYTKRQLCERGMAGRLCAWWVWGGIRAHAPESNKLGGTRLFQLGRAAGTPQPQRGATVRAFSGGGVKDGDNTWIDPSFQRRYPYHPRLHPRRQNIMATAFLPCLGIDKIAFWRTIPDHKLVVRQVPCWTISRIPSRKTDYELGFSIHV